MQIIVTGGRDYTDWRAVNRVLDTLNPDRVIVGDCPTGVDKYVLQWVRKGKVDYMVYRAKWGRHGRAAGPIRNHKMVDDNAIITDLVIAFPGGNGTEDCKCYARNKGLIVLEVYNA